MVSVSFEQAFSGKTSHTYLYMLSKEASDTILYRFLYDADRTHDLSLTGRTLYHWAAAAPVFEFQTHFVKRNVSL